MNVSAVIVNYNTTKYLENCLNSIIKYTGDIEYEIIVIDNHSTERDIEELTEEFPSVKFYFRDVNDGFGSGCNFGADKALGKYLLFVNPDIIFRSDVISVFFKYMEERNDVCLCSGLHLDENDKLIYSFDNFPNFITELREAFYFGYNKHIQKLLGKKEIVECQPFEIDYSLGALLFLKKKEFIDIGGFDERFFLYSEDVDLGHRLKNKGKSICIPSVKVFHSYNSSVKQISGKFVQTYHLNRSKLIYMYKYYGFLKRNTTRILMILGISLRLVYLPFNKVHKGNRANDFKRIFKGLTVFFNIYNIDKIGKIYS